ncbi:MAG: SDR family NAD(P)-dependent oxidoreductase, partial [Bryobacterales bacterium]|nr:SDR family NAD(P)-dependent oxidoreductase [Bryobacterales bacterium]
MACRFPGGAGLESFRTLLRAGGDAVVEGEPGSGQGRIGGLFPDVRSPPDPRRFAAFVEDPYLFDAAFFGISDNEARLMDPQHRLLLEVSWHALENAAIAPGNLAGTRTGVFAGIGDSGYRECVPPDETATIYAAIGNSLSAAIGRIAYSLGLQGPALAVDTASSSSLVAVHQAILALERGEADLALAGGVNLILSPTRTEAFANAGMLADDGRCRSFAAAAQGYVRGEGCGIVVLEPLDRAVAAGRRILGVIRGSAVNQDGASIGLTAPNGRAQTRLIEEALERAGWAPSDVDYLEGHGSGTPLGDPVEVAAALEVYGRGRSRNHPLLLGSVKTNVGHLEEAAGIAGLIKLVLALEEGVIPGQIHFDEPNPRIAWGELAVRVVTKPTHLSRGEGRRMRGAVSSFGLSGTNVHVLVEEYPGREDAEEEQGRARILPLSAKTPEALGRLAGRYRSWLTDGTEARLRGLAWTATVGRTHFGVRAGLVFRDTAELRSALLEVEAGERATHSEPSPKVAFVFPARCEPWIGMGRMLYASEAAVRDALDHCDALFREECGTRLLPLMFGDDGAAGKLSTTFWTQPALYALGCALAAFWREAGIRPSAVLGCGVGEVAAAHAAGMVGLEDGLRFAIERGRLMAPLSSGDGMGAVFLTAGEAADRIPELGGGMEAGCLSVASDNGLHQVLSGSRGPLARVLGRLEAQGVRTVLFPTSEAARSALTNPILDAIERAGEAMDPGPGSVPFVSSRTGRVVRGPEDLDRKYWRSQIRPVHFATAVGTLSELGIRILLDFGPRGRTSRSALGAWPVDAPAPLVAPTLSGPSGSDEGAFSAIARVWEAGAPVRLSDRFGGDRPRPVSAPRYPFERRRYRVDGPEDGSGKAERVGSGFLGANVSPPLRIGSLQALLLREARSLARLDEPPAPETGFFELGLESLQIVELRNRLNRALGGRYTVSQAEMFAHSNAALLAAHVVDRLGTPAQWKEPLRTRERSATRVPRRDPVAVVGIGCRFPGGGGVDEFWRSLAEGRDLVTRGRPDGALPGEGRGGGGGRESKPWGAYLPELDRFDAEFFRIAPREAELMDPQQRLLLEVSWEAIEDAGIAPGGLRGSRTGVYAAMFTNDYQSLVAETPPGLYRSTGSSFSAAIGRIAYTLGLEGPAIAMDTACSGSLVALHQAVASLERGEVDLALAGGVNTILTSQLTEAFTVAGILAPDGRCKTFDATADGYVRGEGCGILVLERLSDARAGGRRVLGLILGSAVNQDGASAGLTAPNGHAQERVIREALERAGVEPASVDYLEAHGSGTPIGDPIELEAAASAYGKAREAERPLLVGSVKTNIGHLEAAAGVAGVIKVLLSMRAGLIPGHLHFKQPNPRLDWKNLPLAVVREATHWAESGRPRRAAVSSFGYSGTNAHIVLEAPREAKREQKKPKRAVRVLPLSGASAGAVRELARRHLRHLRRASRETSWLADAAWTAGTGRSHLGRRAAVAFRDAASLGSGLRGIAEAEGAVGAAPGGPVAFLYTGQGSQWAGMGRELYETEPVFRAVMDRCEEVFRAERGASLLDVILEDSERLDRTEWTQPALYALESSLTALWRSVGIRPDVVFGHSVGEIAAAAAAGAFDLETGMRFATRRGALMGSLPAGGAMAAVFASPDRVRDALWERVALAADNGAHQVVSGQSDAVASLAEELAKAGIRVNTLRTSHAFHSALMDPVLEELEAAAPEASEPSVCLVSNLSGRVLEGAPDGRYWRRQARRPVQCATAVRTLAALKAGLLLEIGPHGVLGPMAALAWPGSETPTVISSQQRNGSGNGDFVGAVAGLYQAGLDIAFEGLFVGERRCRVSLPTYPFQGEPYWAPTHAHRPEPEAGHALLGVQRDSPDGRHSFQRHLYSSDPAWLADHRVFGEVVAPGALYAAQVSEALRETHHGIPVVVEETSITRPLVWSNDEARLVQVVLCEDRSWKVVSRDAGGRWETHAEGRWADLAAEASGPVDFSVLNRGLTQVDVEEGYLELRAAGLDFGSAFRGLVRLWSGPGEALGEVLLPAGRDHETLLAHPAVLGACFQVLEGIRELAGAGGAWLPTGWDRFVLRDALPDRIFCRALERGEDGGARRADLWLYKETGEEVACIEGLALRRTSRTALSGHRVEDALFEVVWRQGKEVGPREPSFLAGPREIGSSLQALDGYLEAEGRDRASLVALGHELEREARRQLLRGFQDLGWEPGPGDRFETDELRRRLRVTGDQRRLFGRLLTVLEEMKFLELEPSGAWRVAAVPGPSPGPGTGSADTESESIELGLLRRCGASLAKVLRGRADALDLLFSGEPGAANLYRESPVMRAVNRMVADGVRTAVGGLPDGRPLRVIEIGAGTGATTSAILDVLPDGRTEYTFTDVSTAFFPDAERRFGERGADLRFLGLDIERDPADQGFVPHGYDLVIAANVLHATRDLGETLTHCRRLLAPSGVLVAVEDVSRKVWLDLIFGLLPGWWRFRDRYRSDYALVPTAVWRQALADTGFLGTSFVEVPTGPLVILARGPSEVQAIPGRYVLAGTGAFAEALEGELRNRGQEVATGPVDGQRTSWGSFFKELDGEVPLRGVVHLEGVRRDARELSTADLAEDVEEIGTSALALVQGMSDAGVSPANGTWFVSRGGQVLGRERSGALPGALLWGFTSVVDLEHGDLTPRLLDLDPEALPSAGTLADELLFPDGETRVARRQGGRLVARLTRFNPRVELPEDGRWRWAADPNGALDAVRLENASEDPGPGEVRVRIEAAGVNFHDVMVGMQVVDSDQRLGGELCGRVVAVGEGVREPRVGDRVAGFASGAFGPEAIARAECVAPTPPGHSAVELATIPIAFVTAELAFARSGLEKGARVLIHAGTGGVGHAAIRLAQAAGLEVYATASKPKQEHLRSLGVRAVFDSRSTAFGEEILEATGGAGVAMVLNSFSGEGHIEASLSCLAPGGCFVELGKRNIRSAGEMATARPDVRYRILALDRLMREKPERLGRVLRSVMERVGSGEFEPLPFNRWPLAEAGAALTELQAARHTGKVVLVPSPLAAGRLRGDRSYLVAGGLAGIGLDVARWLAETGAGAIVLNGRSQPDAHASMRISELREAGAEVRIEIADVTDPDGVAGMIERIDAELPPLAGVIHSVEDLADAALMNQDLERFERVLAPKVVEAWRLHRATLDRELDLFVLFSGLTGVVGKPGQANCAAANAFLDQLARHRRALGLPGQAIAWGAWSGAGEAEKHPGRTAPRGARLDDESIAPDHAIQALARLVREDVGTSVVASLDWSALPERTPWLADVMGGDEIRSSVDPNDLLSRLRALAPGDFTRELIRFLQEQVVEILRLRSAPSPSAGFFELGMDSLMAVELRNRLNRALQETYVVSHTAVIDHPDIARLAEHLAGELPGVSQEVPRARALPAARRRDDERIAIIGMACRFPGAPDAEAFRAKLRSGADMVTKGRPDGLFVNDETEAARPFGAYVEGLDRFDAGFFRIAPVEAELLDPQQRMLLETSWAALEDAGIAPGGLRGSRTGVYGGFMASDYQEVLARAADDPSTNIYRSTGIAASTAVGRVAFALGLEGPAITVDTACSSSLVALHQAAAALRAGEADLVLAGGVNAILTATATRIFGDAGMLAADGRCKTFDAAADGYVRGEGCGMVVMKRLADAEAAGDRILAVVLGSAVNQDGASAGLTVPNGPAQERVIEEALARAGVDAASVDYLEAHGTGTELGDPVEVAAAAAVYGRGRSPDRPLLIGSVKTNVGHLEAAAGVAGLIKTVFAIQSGVIPQHLHFERPNPRMNWEELPVLVTSEATPWPESERPRRAAVSSFGFSGTNAHVVIEGYAEQREPPRVWVSALPESARDAPGPLTVGPRRHRLLPLSAKSEDALRHLADRYRAALSEDLPLADLAWTASVGRSHFRYRSGLVYSDRASLSERLEAVRQRAVPLAHEGPVAFLYTGQGSQWVGMGRQLYETEPVFRAVLDRCEGVFRAERGASLLQVMFEEPGGQRLGRTEWTQPALYALQSGLTALWVSVGVRPDVVFGHSVGEIAAAAAAGAFDLETGMRFATRRGALMGSLPDGGAMAAVFASPERVRDALGGTGVRVALAADNGAHQVVSGPRDVVAALSEELADAGIRVDSLRTSHAFHCALMDPVLAQLEAAAPEASEPSVRLVSDVSGRVLDSAPDGVYWRRQAREPVQFAKAVQTLVALEAGLLLEIGPHAVLGPMAALAWSGSEAPTPISSQQRNGNGNRDFVGAVASAYEAGLDVAFEGLFAGERRRRISLPAYPFERERYWTSPSQRAGSVAGHALLGLRRDSPDGEHSFERKLHSRDPAWLADHRVLGEVVAPGALYAVQVNEALRETHRELPVVLHETSVTRPLVLSGDEGRLVQVVLGKDRTWKIVSRDGGSRWETHAEGRWAHFAGAEGPPADLGAWKTRLAPVDADFAWGLAGLEYGPAFRGLVRVWSGSAEAVGEVLLPPGMDYGRLLAHPALLDACFQVLGGIEALAGAGGAWLPIGWDRFVLRDALPDHVFCRALDRGDRRGTRRANLWLYRDTGEEVACIEGFALRRASRIDLSGFRVEDSLHEVVWREGAEVGLREADFLAGPQEVKAGLGALDGYFEAEGRDGASLTALGRELEREARRQLLSGFRELGWEPEPGNRFETDELRRRLMVTGDHGRLFGRLLTVLEEPGLLQREPSGGWCVAAMPEPPAEREAGPTDTEAESIEMGVLRRCGASLAEVLRGRADALDLLFGGDPGAARLYRESPAIRAVNRMVAEGVRTAVGGLPAGRQLRVIEIGAGTGATTSAVLDVLPAGRAEYTFTDVSTAFFPDAERRLGERGADLRYLGLDIELDPADQGFALHGYDLVIAANVLHATRDLGEALAHCRSLLAPSGVLVAVEDTIRKAWLDLTFGLLPGWWRFRDGYRSDYALVPTEVWRQALTDTGFVGTSFVEVPTGPLVILARGPSEVQAEPGRFVLAGTGAFAEALQAELRKRGQEVVSGPGDGRRTAWRSFLEGLDGEAPLRGVVHLEGVRRDARKLSTAELAEDAEEIGAGALALVQGMSDAGVSPENGMWFVTRGGQVIGRERSGALPGAMLWGFVSVVDLEHGDLAPRLLDLDPEVLPSVGTLADELLFPDGETRVARRQGARLVARLSRFDGRVVLPVDGRWRWAAAPSGALDAVRVEDASEDPGPGEVRVRLEAAGVNFHDVMVGMQVVDADQPLGSELCGRVVEVGEGVRGLQAGDRVAGFAPGAFGPEVITRADCVVPSPPGHSAPQLATVPVASVTAELAFADSGLGKGARVLIHAGTGGVGHAAIRWAQAAGLEVYATASAPKQEYLRSLGIRRVFDSRSTAFGEEILEATGGAGVAMVLNSLSGEGFIEASLSCLAPGGSFVELGKRNIRSVGEMAADRPDVRYRILALDRLMREEPQRLGQVLRSVMERVGSGELEPLPFTRWPLAETGAALAELQAARHTGKLVLVPSPLAGGRLRGDRSYLVTGGLGGIGLEVARWLAEAGAGAIVLNGRRQPDTHARALISELRERGAEVRIEIADVTDPDGVAGMLGRTDSELPPLAGVIHSVGELADAALTNQDWERFERVVGPKMLGAWRLHRATLDRELDLFVLFSSLVGVVGGPGQANYAAANAFLDQLARHRRALGLPGQAIAWGTWSGVGEAKEHRERIATRRSQLGEKWIAPGQGVRALARLVREDVATSVVGSLDWSALPVRTPWLEEVTGRSEIRSSADSGDLPRRLLGLARGERREELIRFLQEQVVLILRLRSAPSPSAGFFELGMDSLMAVELRSRLNRAFREAFVLSNTAVFDHPDIARLAEHLAGKLAGVAPKASRARALPAVRRRDGERVAIVGMACRFPGAPDADAFWSQIRSGADSVTRGRPDRLFVDAETEAARPFGAYVEGLDRFDAGFFRIAPVEAELLDPQQRMLLETSWAALEDAGIAPDGLHGSRTGVYGGVCGHDYESLVATHRDVPSASLYRSTGVSASAAVGRVAFALGLEGPAITVDTACSSSLVALHQAAAALRAGEADLALAGGVNAILTSTDTRTFADAGMLAADGRCKTFDAAADGFVRGEGCGMVVLKRLADAEAAGDPILAVLLGSAVNQDGASAGLTVPNGPAQERVIEEALARAGVEASTVDYLEAHGTGTELGDPVEVAAAAAVYGRGRSPDRPLLIGSVKTNVGHLEAAA